MEGGGWYVHSIYDIVWRCDMFRKQHMEVFVNATTYSVSVPPTLFVIRSGCFIKFFCPIYNFTTLCVLTL